MDFSSVIFHWLCREAIFKLHAMESPGSLLKLRFLGLSSRVSDWGPTWVPGNCVPKKLSEVNAADPGSYFEKH